MGGLYICASIFFIVLMLIDSFLFGSIVGYSIVIITSKMGVLLLVFGIRDILRKEHNPAKDRGDINNLYGERIMNTEYEEARGKSLRF